LDVVEDGNSFGENATKKATQQARYLNRWVLAEDSGISVPVLNGAPGIYSARFSGPDATDEKNNLLLLEKLADFAGEKRTAFYTCYMVLSDPEGIVRFESEGRCYGRILTSAHGHNGFGYDPLFEVVEYHKTFGELAPEVKRVISHRARAGRQLIPKLFELIDHGELKS
ncbi:MAG: non-canonical purine NTP pyrophosphatase, partial [Thermoguttaceae bacterium]|nr:non-canonical purine NTP pyrophosphatase [Thermoguttaceae bacterium]